MVNLPGGQQNSDAYRAIHPLGVVPALKTGDYTIFESVAIVLQLIDEHPEKNLAPAVGTPERANYYQWSVFACAELDPPIMMFFDNTMRPLEVMRTAESGIVVRGRKSGGFDQCLVAQLIGAFKQQDDLAHIMAFRVI
tara:strand:+ start:2230 stop:2643 length:414 start_codon:yes stop_codon:yes gene_type:complete